MFLTMLDRLSAASKPGETWPKMALDHVLRACEDEGQAGRGVLADLSGTSYW